MWTVDHDIVAAALAVIAFFAVKVLHDIKGVSKKCNKLIALLYEWDGLDEKHRRAALSEILKGR